MIVDWFNLETEYRGTNTPVLQLANKYGVSEGAIRARAKKNGWVRSGGKLKRSLVESKMVGITNRNTNYDIRNLIEQGADQDAADMKNALAVARGCLCKLLIITEVCEDPREIKIILEGNKTATDTIRKIRGLDAEPDERDGDVSTLSRKELEDIARGKA